jgi:hypothetical protein
MVLATLVWLKQASLDLIATQYNTIHLPCQQKLSIGLKFIILGYIGALQALIDF